MNQKIEITKHILNSMNLDVSDQNIKKTIPIWWYNTRQKSKGGLRLTEQGFESFKKAGIKEYRIEFQDQIKFTNQLMVWLDNFIDCPFYLQNNKIYVFSEKMAVQLILFSGNIYKFSAAKANRQST